jgi:hypothetical protein
LRVVGKWRRKMYEYISTVDVAWYNRIGTIVTINVEKVLCYSASYPDKMESDVQIL